MKNESYIPALSYESLTPFYDTVVRLTTREKAFKSALIAGARIGSHHHVLDLGCGTGTLTLLIKEAVPSAETIGLDADAKVLDIARRKTAARQLEIQFDQGMSYALEYPAQKFDRVISSLFFHHLGRSQKLQSLREVLRVLKIGGELHIADWGKPSNLPMRFASYGIKLLDGRETTADNFNGLLPSLLEESGFRKIEESQSFDTLFGTVRLHSSIKPSREN